MLRIACIFTVLFACTSSSAPTEDGASVECTAKVATMRALFAQGTDELAVVYLPDDGQLAASGRGTAITPGIPVYVRRDGAFEFNSALQSGEALQAALADEFDKARQLMENMGRPVPPKRLLLAADVRAPVAALVELSALAPPDTIFALVVELAGDTVPTPPPMPPAVHDVIANAPAQLRAPKFAELLQPSLLGCPAIGEVFEAVATTTADMRAKVLQDGLPAAIERCGCAGVDFDTVLAVTWSMIGKSAAAQRELALPLSRDPNTEAVPLPVDATVADLVTVLETREGRPFHVVVQ